SPGHKFSTYGWTITSSFHDEFQKLLYSPSVCVKPTAGRRAGRIRRRVGLRVRLPPILTHRVATHLDTMGVVHEPIENAVGQRGIADRSCQRETSSCDVRIVEPTWYRSSQISQKSRRSGSLRGVMAQSSITRT